MSKARNLANLGTDTSLLATDSEVTAAVAPKVNRAGDTYTGIHDFTGATVSGVTDLQINSTLNAPFERLNISATAATGTVNVETGSLGSVWYYTSNATGNFTLNFRTSATVALNTTLAVGESITVTFLNTNGATAYYANAVQVDGTVVTPKWQGGTAPTAGNASAIDAYTFVIIKTASATFTVLASARGFGWSLAAGSAAGFESIATVTATGGETSLTFTSIPQNYVALQIRGIARGTTAILSGYTSMVMNGDTGTTYTLHYLSGNGSSASAGGVGDREALNTWLMKAAGNSATSGVFGAGIIDIHGYASTSAYKTIRSFSGVDGNDTAGNFSVQVHSTLWRSTSAVTSLSVNALNGFTSFAAGTTFALYGIRGAA